MINLNLILISNFVGGRDQALGRFIFHRKTTNRTLLQLILIIKLKVSKEELLLIVLMQIIVKQGSIIV